MKYFLTFFILTISFPSLAGIHIEPYVGYGFTIISKDRVTKETLNNVGESFSYLKDGKKFNDLTAGLRLGYRSLGLALGVDFSAAKWESLTGSEVLTPVTAGIFASYNLPLLFRIYGVLIPKTFAWVSVGVKDKSKANEPLVIAEVLKASSQPIPFHCKKSSGGKVGLSYLSIPFLSINFEYQSLYIDGDSKACGAWSNTGTVFLNFMF